MFDIAIRGAVYVISNVRHCVFRTTVLPVAIYLWVYCPLNTRPILIPVVALVETLSNCRHGVEGAIVFLATIYHFDTEPADEPWYQKAVKWTMCFRAACGLMRSVAEELHQIQMRMGPHE